MLGGCQELVQYHLIASHYVTLVLHGISQLRTEHSRLHRKFEGQHASLAGVAEVAH